MGEVPLSRVGSDLCSARENVRAYDDDDDDNNNNNNSNNNNDDDDDDDDDKINRTERRNS